MSREAAKRLKDSLEMAKGDGQVREAALALLRHSLRLGHRRLSLRRLELAVGCGAELTREDLQRCAELALRVSDPQVHERLARLSRILAPTDLAGTSPIRAGIKPANNGILTRHFEQESLIRFGLPESEGAWARLEGAPKDAMS